MNSSLSSAVARAPLGRQKVENSNWPRLLLAASRLCVPSERDAGRLACEQIPTQTAAATFPIAIPLQPRDNEPRRTGVARRRSIIIAPERAGGRAGERQQVAICAPKFQLQSLAHKSQKIGRRKERATQRGKRTCCRPMNYACNIGERESARGQPRSQRPVLMNETGADSVQMEQTIALELQQFVLGARGTTSTDDGGGGANCWQARRHKGDKSRWIATAASQLAAR